MSVDVHHLDTHNDDAHAEHVLPAAQTRAFNDLNALLADLRAKLGTTTPERYLSSQHWGVEGANCT